MNIQPLSSIHRPTSSQEKTVTLTQPSDSEQKLDSFKASSPEDKELLQADLKPPKAKPMVNHKVAYKTSEAVRKMVDLSLMAGFAPGSASALSLGTQSLDYAGTVYSIATDPSPKSFLKGIKTFAPYLGYTQLGIPEASLEKGISLSSTLYYSLGAKENYFKSKKTKNKNVKVAYQIAATSRAISAGKSALSLFAPAISHQFTTAIKIGLASSHALGGIAELYAEVNK